MVFVCVSVCIRSISVNSLDLEQEVDPLNVDHFSCTPLVRHTHTLLAGSVCIYVADNVMMTQNVFVCSCVVVCVSRCGRVLWVIRRQRCCCTAGAARLWESPTLWVVCLWLWLIHADTHGWHAVWRSYTHTLRHKNTHLTRPRLRTGPCLRCPAAPTQVTHTHTALQMCFTWAGTVM